MQCLSRSAYLLTGLPNAERRGITRTRLSFFSVLCDLLIASSYDRA